MGPVNNFYYQYNRPAQPNPVRPTTSCLGFIDVEANTEFCNAVILSAQEQLFTGSLNEAGLQTLRADDFVTKAEATAIIVRLLGIQPSDYNPNLDGNLGFKDLDPTQWYMPYFKTISQLAIRQTQNTTNQDWIKTILQAYPDGTIRPTQPITRIQFYKLSLEAIKQSKNIKSNFTLNYEPKNSAFSDTKFSKANLRYLPYSNFIQTKLGRTNFGQKYFAQNKFKPNQALTRAEVIEFIYELQVSKNIQF
jgi:hypothetical protein